MKINIKDLEGAVSVDGDVTPITRTPIDQVNSSDWSKLNISELYDQRATLQKRLYMAMQYAPAAVVQIQRGIAMLDSIIESQPEDSGKLI